MCKGLNRIFDTLEIFSWSDPRFDQEDLAKIAKSIGCRGCNILHCAICLFPEYFDGASYITIEMKPWGGAITEAFDETTQSMVVKAPWVKKPQSFFTIGVKQPGFPMTIFDLFKTDGMCIVTLFECRIKRLFRGNAY
jgi:hypothetical protein